jgi:hypothetical protein
VREEFDAGVDAEEVDGDVEGRLAAAGGGVEVQEDDVVVQGGGTRRDGGRRKERSDVCLCSDGRDSVFKLRRSVPLAGGNPNTQILWRILGDIPRTQTVNTNPIPNYYRTRRND